MRDPYHGTRLHTETIRRYLLRAARDINLFPETVVIYIERTHPARAGAQDWAGIEVLLDEIERDEGVGMDTIRNALQLGQAATALQR